MSLRKIMVVIAAILVALVAAVAFVLQQGSSSEFQDRSNDLAVSKAESSNEEPGIELIDSGFGENDIQARATVLMKATGENAAGKLVTATVNFYDGEGSLLATEEGKGYLDWDDQDFALNVDYYKGSETSGLLVDNIEVFVSLDDSPSGRSASNPMPVLETGEISDGYFEDYKAAFALNNGTESDIREPRVDVACFDDSGNIVGGGYDFPSLIPAGATVRIDATVITSEKPATCKAYMNPSGL